MAASFLAFVMALQTALAVPSQAPPVTGTPVPPPSAQSTAAPPDYLVGPQDVLKITVFGEPQLSPSVRVDSDGTIPYQYLGRVKVEELTTTQIAEAIRKGLADGYVRTPQVSVEVEQYHSQNVYVLGEVKAPAKYELRGNSTLMDVLTQAGSTTPQAGHWVLINHARQGTTTGPTLVDNATADLKINLNDIQSGKAQNVRILDGDTVYVPKAVTVFVTGNVRTPGAYPYDDGMTVFDAVGMAGGVNERGSNSRIAIRRMINGKLKEISVKPVDKVQPGDQVEVKARRL